MAYIRLCDLISYAYWTWCFSFEDAQEDLMDVLKLAMKEGITEIGLGNGKVVYLSEYDLNDLVDFLLPYTEEILEEVKSNEYVDIENY